MLAWLAVISGLGVATMAAVGGVLGLVCALGRLATDMMSPRTVPSLTGK